MKIGLAQINPIVGDLDGNMRLIVDAATSAAQQGADLLVTPELAISGYPPKDLLLREGFAAACDRALASLCSQLPAGISALVGHPTIAGNSRQQLANAASLISADGIAASIHKLLLPNYDVFDEQRYFRPADNVAPIEFQGKKLGVHICEDAWWGQPRTFYHDHSCDFPNPVEELAGQGAELLINLSASPFEVDKHQRRIDIFAAHAKSVHLPAVFVNQVGGNDDLVFDGASFVMNGNGDVKQQLPDFKSSLTVCDLDTINSQPSITFDTSREEQLYDALVLGLHDYLRKCGFTDCVLGLSGGIDSALAACIAAEAMGADHVHGLLMPSRYSSDHSVDDARKLAENLGIDHHVIPIDAVHKAYETIPVVGPDVLAHPGGLADQNLQARIRGASVMVESNQHGWLALATGNKSELAIGYCTLYGDMAGGFAVLCDLLKRDVYGVSRYVNERHQREIIPESTLSKAPSAELAPDQFDQDTLPPYDVLDPILEGLIEREESVGKLCEQFSAEVVNWVATRLDRNEFKRRQMPPGIKLSQRAFGSGRRMPMAARIDPTYPTS